MIRIIGIATALILVTASSFSANAGQRFGVQGGSALDKPTFGEKFMMPLHKNRSVNSVKGTKHQRGNTERELMDKMMRVQH